METKSESSMARTLRAEQHRNTECHHLTGEDTHKCARFTKWQNWAIIGLLSFGIGEEVNREVLNSRLKRDSETIENLEDLVWNLNDDLRHKFADSGKIEDVLKELETLTEKMGGIPAFHSSSGN
jgi:hypothetical protein